MVWKRRVRVEPCHKPCSLLQRSLHIECLILRWFQQPLFCLHSPFGEEACRCPRGGGRRKLPILAPSNPCTFQWCPLPGPLEPKLVQLSSSRPQLLPLSWQVVIRLQSAGNLTDSFPSASSLLLSQPGLNTPSPCPRVLDPPSGLRVYV